MENAKDKENKEFRDYLLGLAVANNYVTQEEVDSMTDEEKAMKANEFKDLRPV